ncbi:hypothetical protein COOONC_17588, partial [Cooperia oncophora]
MQISTNCKPVQLATGLRNYLDLSFAYRALSEICAEEGLPLKWRVLLSDGVTNSRTITLNNSFQGDRKEALEYASLFRQTAQQSGSHSQIQLSLHVTGWVYEKLNMQQSHNTADLEEERLCSGLCANLQRKSEAEKYWNSAYSYAKRTHDADLEYQLLLARIDFSWESPVNNAQRLVNFAPTKKKGYALMELAQ